MENATNTANGKPELKVGGQVFGGWQEVEATRSIEQISGTFRLDVTERWGGQYDNFVISPGDGCQLLLNGVPVVTGYVDDVEPSFTSSKHSVSVTGRDRTGDLVDCSAIHKSGQWQNVGLDVIVRDLIRPYGIELLIQTALGDKFPSYSIQEGETVFECIERACRLRAVLPVADARGNLMLTQAQDKLIDDVLAQGDNILEATGHFSHKDRFSLYKVKGQDVSTDDDFNESKTHLAGEARDENIKRHRPLIVLAEDHGNGATLSQRAAWEANVRLGRGSRADITVEGWTRKNGEVWVPNTLVHVRSPKLYVDSPMLIVACTYRKSLDGGTTTTLSIARREAFVLLKGVSANKLTGALKAKEQKAKKGSGKKSDDWSML